MVAHGGQGGSRDVDLDGSGATPLVSEDPRQIGPYPIVGLLGVGGMGRVYLGVAEGRYAAVKRVLPALAEDPGFLRHFNHELDNLARLPAGVSVPLLETGRTENPPWFATEYIPGLTLTEAVLPHGGPLPSEALWYLLRELASRLAALHALDMLHRDVKPSNVMITLGGLALIDFGIARAADQSRLTRTGMVLGTPEYMAPEQAEGKKGLTAAADVFALGSLLFFAATGASPFGQGSGLDVLYRIVHNEPDLAALRELDPDLASIVAACLDKSPSARPTAAELLERCTVGPEPGGAVWPAAVAERLERRAAFAADVPALDDFNAATAALKSPPPSTAGGGAAGGAVAGQEGGAVGPPPAEAAAVGGESAKNRRQSGERRRRALRLPVIVPLVLAAGGITVVTLLPYAYSHNDGKSSDTPSVVLSTSPSADGPASSARPSRSSSASASAHTSGNGTKPGSGSKKADAGPTPESGGSSSGGSGGSGRKSGGTPGAGAPPSGGSSSSSGGSSSGGSGGGSGGTITIGSSGTYRIKDASDGACLEQDTSSGSPSSYAVSSSCSSTNGSYSEWTFSPGPNGTFKVINKGSGSCLTAFMASGWINMDTCGSNSGQYWRIGSTRSSGSTLESTAYSQCMEVAPASSARVTGCNAANSAQLWGYAGKG